MFLLYSRGEISLLLAKLQARVCYWQVVLFHSRQFYRLIYGDAVYTWNGERCKSQTTREQFLRNFPVTSLTRWQHVQHARQVVCDFPVAFVH